MKAKIIETGKHFVVYALSSALQSIIGFLLLPLLTKYFSPAEFGIYSFLTLASTLVSALFFFGASSILSRYFFDSNNLSHKQAVVSTTFLITLIGAGLQIGFSIVFCKRISFLLTDSYQYATQVFYSLLSGALGFIMNYGLMILRLEKRSQVFVRVNIVSNIINILIVYVVLVYLHGGIYAPVFGQLVANLVTAGTSFFYFRKYLWGGIQKSMLWEYIVFGFSTTLNGLAYYFLDWLDRFFIKEYGSLSDVGIYSMGYRIGMLIQVALIIPFSMIWSTIRMQYSNDKDNKDFISKMISYYTIAGLFVVAAIAVFSKELLYIFSSQAEYRVAYKIVPVILVAHLLYGYINIVDYGIFLSKKLHFYYITFIIASVLNAGLNYIFIPFYGYMAAAYITLLTYLFCALVIYFIGLRFYNYQIDRMRVLLPFVIVVPMIIVTNEFTFPLFTGIFVKTFLIISFLFLIYFMWLSRGEKRIINGIPSKVKHFLM